MAAVLSGIPVVSARCVIGLSHGGEISTVSDGWWWLSVCGATGVSHGAGIVVGSPREVGTICLLRDCVVAL